MIKILKLTEDTIEQRVNMVKQFEASRVQTGIKSIDTVFTSLYSGSVYSVCASTGVGKTTFLLATAKKMAQKGQKVLFLSIEMSLVQVIKFCPEVDENLTIAEFDGMWFDVLNYCREEGIQVVCYDYIGARLNDWDQLIKEADALAEIAKELNIVIFTAMQATSELYAAYQENSNSPLLYTNQYVAFSKGMINKMAGAAYIIRSNDKSYLYCMKNRYFSKYEKPVFMGDINYRTKEWQDD